MNLLDVKDLKMHFPIHGGVLARKIGAVKAVDGISLSLSKGQTLGVVGESGCGKSTLGKAIVRLTNPTAGSIHVNGTDVTHLSQWKLRPLRKQFQMMFQDPAESLNPRMSVGEIITEPLLIQKIGNARSRREMAIKLLDRVGMAASAVDKFSFEFSGGQRQRIGIARAIALKPELLVLDEPVSALDVSVQSQVLNLLMELQEEMGIAYMFIAHDLAVVKHISDQVAVMYLGKIVELADADVIYKKPKHAYTKALLSAIPIPDPTVRRDKVILEGEIPSPINPPKGSAFGHRINHPNYLDTEGLNMPLVEIDPGHWVAADPCCLSDDDYLKARTLV